jgi:hypothetical protein
MADAWTRLGEPRRLLRRFPVRYWEGFDPRAGLPAALTAELPSDIGLAPELADIGNVVEAKIQGIARYESQVPHLFGSIAKMAEAVRTQGAAVALSTGRSGSVERYWAAVRRS